MIIFHLTSLINVRLRLEVIDLSHYDEGNEEDEQHISNGFLKLLDFHVKRILSSIYKRFFTQPPFPVHKAVFFRYLCFRLLSLLEG